LRFVPALDHPAPAGALGAFERLNAPAKTDGGWMGINSAT
jgi:hypothetical protein